MAQARLQKRSGASRKKTSKPLGRRKATKGGAKRTVPRKGV